MQLSISLVEYFDVTEVQFSLQKSSVVVHRRGTEKLTGDIITISLQGGMSLMRNLIAGDLNVRSNEWEQIKLDKYFVSLTN